MGKGQLGRRRSIAIAVGLCLVWTAPAAALVPGPTDGELEAAAERAEALHEDAEQAGAVTRLLERRLWVLERRLTRATHELEAAEADADAALDATRRAAAAVRRTAAELRETEARLVENQQRLDDAARSAYVHGGSVVSPGLAAASSLASGASLGETADAMHFLGAVAEHRSTLLDETRELLLRTKRLQAELRAAETRASERAAAADAALEEAASRSAAVLALVDDLDATVREQQDETLRIEQERDDAGAALDQLEQARAEAVLAAEDAIVARELGRGLVSVGGITVASSLAPALEDLLEAAWAEGIVLTGSGYRTRETTARLRQVNGCPDTHTSSPSECRVPTARPGESMHERGLAIDFAYKGRTICYPRPASECEGNPAFDWLTEHAEDFGLSVLSSEAWHWSVGGH